MDFLQQLGVAIAPEYGTLLEKGLIELQQHCTNAYGNYSQAPTCVHSKRTYLTDESHDPLEYIHIYKNMGDPCNGIPKHWHYIGFGLSDIRGYNFFRHTLMVLSEGRQTLKLVYPPPHRDYKMSGFGFELTMRVKCNSTEEWNGEPPEWPRSIMQGIARYVFRTMNILHPGDHIAWHSPLDNDDEGSSRINQILLTLDPQLRSANTLWGPVTFIQIVGVCTEELQAAREWNVKGILEMLAEREETGGMYFVTDMRRGETLFELDPDKQDRLEAAIQQMGSEMAQVSARHKTSYRVPEWFLKVEKMRQQSSNIDLDYSNSDPMTMETALNAKDIFNQDKQKRDEEDEYLARPPSRMSIGSESALNIENADMYDTRYYDNMYILLSYESAKALPVMLNGRLAHGRHFSFQSPDGDSTITFKPEGSPIESLVNPERPYARKGHWLQIYVPPTLREQMHQSVREDFDQRKSDPLDLPKNYSWPDFNLHMTIVSDMV